MCIAFHCVQYVDGPKYYWLSLRQKEVRMSSVCAGAQTEKVLGDERFISSS